MTSQNARGSYKSEIETDYYRGGTEGLRPFQKKGKGMPSSGIG